MNTDDKRLLYAITENEPASFAEISFRSKMATDFLGLKLDDLLQRGFIHLNQNQYSLAAGVKESLLN